MEDKEVKKRIQALVKEISDLRYRYHVENDPTVTDDVYDSLTRELHMLINKHPNYASLAEKVDRVAGRPLAVFKKVKHDVRMLSLNDAFSRDEVAEWTKRIAKLIKDTPHYFCELKMDGLAVSLVYENGIFIRGATRGDGYSGEDITENLKMITMIPLVLPEGAPSYIEVRGEVVMARRIWKKLNEIQKKEGKPLFANTRNAAAGSVRQLDPALTKARQLDFFAYDIVSIRGGNSPKTHSGKHELLHKLGFVSTRFEKRVDTLAEIYTCIDEVEKFRENFAYGTDGLVIMVDELALQEDLGVVGKAPRYALAYKYPAEKATTLVTDITVNVGRTGILTPVAHFSPTFVAGSTVSKATLHNMEQISRLDIRIGDTVVIQKAGDVIPEVVEVLQRMRTGKEKIFTMPQNCPVCGGAVAVRKADSKKDGKSVGFFCSNKKCPAQNQRGIEHFVKVFEIYEVGPKIIARLKDEGLISDAADLFTLEHADLAGLERFGVKSATNIIEEINSKKKVPLWRFLYSLGILHVGEETAKELANHFHTLEQTMNATENNLQAMQNIGPVVSKSVIEYFSNQSNKKFIQKLLNNGVIVERAQKQTGVFSGKTFVLTGTLPTLSREQAKEIILRHGGKVANTVSKNTNYVLSGENAGSKYDAAQALGVAIIDEEYFRTMIK
jgi:DNA ligase (NAD+)